MALRTWIRRLVDRKPRTLRKEPARFCESVSPDALAVLKSFRPARRTAGRNGALISKASRGP
jgi:hypothetical protein